MADRARRRYGVLGPRGLGFGFCLRFNAATGLLLAASATVSAGQNLQPLFLSSDDSVIARTFGGNPPHCYASGYKGLTWREIALAGAWAGADLQPLF